MRTAGFMACKISIKKTFEGGNFSALFFYISCYNKLIKCKEVFDMKKWVKSVSIILVAFAMVALTQEVQAADGVGMYRLYNPNSSEHFYTSNVAERNHLVQVGWKYEQGAWLAPSTGNPVYRLYNPNSGDHHYTMDADEKDALVKLGWRYENIGWRSGGSLPVYRLYNPNAKKAGAHHYTLSKPEADQLVRAGW